MDIDRAHMFKTGVRHGITVNADRPSRSLSRHSWSCPPGFALARCLDSLAPLLLVVLRCCDQRLLVKLNIGIVGYWDQRFPSCVYRAGVVLDVGNERTSKVWVVSSVEAYASPDCVTTVCSRTDVCC